jgi:hypothetical protein
MKNCVCVFLVDLEHNFKRCASGSSPCLQRDWAKFDSPRVQVVEAYENQRFLPMKGWGAQLLPTDRPKWSDKSGKHPRVLDGENHELGSGLVLLVVWCGVGLPASAHQEWASQASSPPSRRFAAQGLGVARAVVRVAGACDSR